MRKLSDRDLRNVALIGGSYLSLGVFAMSALCIAADILWFGRVPSAINIVLFVCWTSIVAPSQAARAEMEKRGLALPSRNYVFSEKPGGGDE